MNNSTSISFWSWWPAWGKLTLAGMFLIGLAVFGTTALSSRRLQRDTRAGLEQQAETLLESLKLAATESLADGETATLNALAGTFNNLPGVLSVNIFDPGGQPIALGAGESSASGAFVGLLLSQDTPAYEWLPDRLIAGLRVQAGEETLGAIQIELGTSALDERTGVLQVQGLLAAFAAAAGVVLLALLLRRSIAGALRGLALAHQQVAGGDLSYQMPQPPGAELPELADSFHKMTSALAQAVARKGAILAAAPIGILTFDPTGKILEINHAARAMFGYPGEEALGKSCSDLIALTDRGDPSEEVFTTFLSKAKTASPDSKFEAVARRQDGTRFPIEIAVTPVSGLSSPLFTTLVRDITERRRASEAVHQAQEALERKVAERTADLEAANQILKDQMKELERAEQALRDREEQFSLATKGANDGLWDWDKETGQAYFSERWKAILGHEDGEIDGHIDAWFQRIHPEDLEVVKADLATHLDGLSPHFENEHRLLHKEGQYIWVLSRGLAVRNPSGEAYRMAGSLTDITERKQAEGQLVHDALHDTLTGLPNRALFLDRLGRAIERTKRRADNLFAVLFLDLDRFKVINDSLGHTIGDQLLIAMGRRLEVFLRSVDTVARLGGDEFVILLEDIGNEADATRVAERIQDELALPFFPNEHKVFTTVSIGIVLSTTGYNRPEEILRDADIAMYRAKARGRARYEVFNTEMRAQAIARLELESDLRRAIGFQEFQIYFQPIMSLENSRIIGFEALVRWQHPTRGLIYPEDFIPVAEETGLIIPIDWWMLHNACQQLAVWQKQYPADPPLTISVNVSAKHFTSLDLVSQVENILIATGLEARSLKLEITETVFMETDETAQEAFARLRNMGIQLQIDDFGTGYSSLSYLQRFPVDTIKIDRSFVSKMDGHTTNSEIVRTIVRLARELNMEAIAEGVETRAQLDQLKDLDCDFGQGYLISKPMDRNAAERLIKESQKRHSAAS